MNDIDPQAAAYDAGRNRQANFPILSTFNLESQIGADDATWLDRRLVSGEAPDLAPAGFGPQVRNAMARRSEHLIDRGHAARQRHGPIFPPVNPPAPPPHPGVAPLAPHPTRTHT